MSATTEVHPFRPHDQEEWDLYATRHPRGTLFHTSAWLKALESLSHRPRHLIARRTGEIVGILPVFLCRNHRLRRGLYSLPHSEGGGALGADRTAEQLLVDAALSLLERGSAASLVLRNRYRSLLELPELAGFVTFERALPESSRGLLLSFNKGARHLVKKAAGRDRLRAEPGCDLETLYPLLCASYHRLGSPVFPRRFFEVLREGLGTRLVTLSVFREDSPLASVLAIRFRNLLCILFSGEADGARPLAPNHFKYFKLMEWAIDQGIERCSFGRSRLSNPGVVAFKGHLGYRPQPLPYQIAGKSNPPSADPNQGIFRLATLLWSRLPRAAVNRLGPRLLPFVP